MTRKGSLKIRPFVIEIGMKAALEDILLFLKGQMVIFRPSFKSLEEEGNWLSRAKVDLSERPKTAR